jgi:hypothetical protein
LTTISSIRFSRSAAGSVIRNIAVCGALVMMLGSCATTKKVADAGQAETAEDAVSLLAAGGMTTQATAQGAAGAYVDPMVATARGRKMAQRGMPASGMRGIAAGTPTQNALTQTYSSTPASMAAAVIEPTGVRAGNMSIFSGHAPANGTQMAAATTTASTAPAPSYPAASAAPTGGVNAMTRSVFSTGTPVACGNDVNGNMISC